MANPQKENGHTQIANELLGALIQSDVSSTELKIVLTIMRKTYGFNKKEDRISLTQFQDYVKVSRSMVCRAIKSLVNQKILVVKHSTLGNKYTINKDYETWVVKESILVNQMDLPSEPNDNQVVNQSGHTKETKQKTYTKYIKGIKFIFCNECKAPHGRHESYCTLNA